MAVQCGWMWTKAAALARDGKYLVLCVQVQHKIYVKI